VDRAAGLFLGEPSGGLSLPERVDRSVQTDARAKPARPDSGAP
jgi:hypothetical protein